MDHATFLGLLNPDASIRQRATEAIEQASANPEFISSLVAAIRSGDVEDARILPLMAAALMTCVRRHAHDLSGNDVFLQSLVLALFSPEPKARPMIAECILCLASNVVPPQGPNFPTIFGHIMNVLSAQTTCNAMDVQTAMLIAVGWVKCSPASDFLTCVGSLVLPFLKGVQGDAQHGPGAVTAIAELVKRLLNRRHIILDAAFDEVLGVLICCLAGETISAEVDAMKVEILELFARLVMAVFEKWKSVPEVVTWRNHFVADVLPPLLQIVMNMAGSAMSVNVAARLLRLFYQFLCFNIAPERIISPEFIGKFVIPLARLDEDDMSNFNDNYAHFIEFCCEHDADVGFFSTRICASRVIHLLLTTYAGAFDPRPLLAAPCSDPIDFEARLFLLEQCAIENMLPDTIFEAYFDMLTEERPLHVVVALLRLITPKMASENAIVGIEVAQHFIVNAECPIIKYCAVQLMLQCMRDFSTDLSALSDLADIKVRELAPALLDLSMQVERPEPSKLLEKVFLIGGSHALEVVPDLIGKFFMLWRHFQTSDEDAVKTRSSLMHSIEKVLEIVPANAPMTVSLANDVLGRLAADIAEFPENDSFADQIAVAAVFNRKLDTPIECQMQFLAVVLKIGADSSLFLTELVSLVCPLMLKIGPTFPAFESLMTICQEMLAPESDADPDTIAQALVLASCMIQAGGPRFLPFVTAASVILAAQQKSVVLVGCLYVFAAAIFIDVDATRQLLSVDTATLVCAGLVKPTPLACRELRMAVIALSCFAKLGHADSYRNATRLMNHLVEMKAIDGDIAVTQGLLARKKLHKQEELLSLSPLLALPIDSFDETAFFMSFGAV